MENIVRTVYSAHLQTAQYMNLPLTIKPNSTLNEKFNIHANLTLTTNELPTLKYFCIGNGGVRVTVGADGTPRTEVVQHRPRDAALYKHLPFVLRPVNSDLTAGERIKYRLRRLETHNGSTYAAYYARTMDFSSTVPVLELRTVNAGVITSTEFSPNIGDLNPTPPAIGSGGVLITTGDYIAANAKVPFTMSVTDIEEFMNVCNVLYGDPNYAIISEIALCSGADRSVTGDFNGTTIGYTESIATQICNFVGTFLPMNAINRNMTVMLNVGSVEPLLTLA
jgi:hypothetical protein